MHAFNQQTATVNFHVYICTSYIIEQTQLQGGILVSLKGFGLYLHCLRVFDACKIMHCLILIKLRIYWPSFSSLLRPQL